MTLRLVALMSVVLLLSLAAVGLLVNHFQAQVMEEVEATASDVGQAALRTLEWTGGVHTRFGEGVVHRRSVRSVEEGATEAPAGGTGPILAAHDVLVARVGADGDSPRIEHIITTSTEDNEFVVREHMIYPAGEFPVVLPGDAREKELEACLQGRLETLSDGGKRIYINVEAVRAEADPGRGLVLKIPKFTPADEVAGSEGAVPGTAIEYEVTPFPEASDEDVFIAHRDEIQLPIRGNYQQLFRKLRNRSLFLFMGVFLVGMVLSTGIASRFTRPIRKLDAGIRRLSDGDLDVEVAVDGKGEIGRLGRAFNEMSGKLRANRDREREMVRREKLSALGRLAAGVAHDVRNPLHSIGLTLQHLSETSRPGSEDRQGEFDHSIGIIRGEIKRLDKLVGNFLQFAKSERHERRPVDLGELLRESVRLVQKECEWGGVKIDLDTGEPLPAVRADAEAIRSTLLNLILNSLAAMPDGGTLTLSARGEGEEVVLDVVDTGEGIPEEEQPHVFDFAYTTREGGSGLGLAMVHHCVVEEHGGRISLESRPGEGTRIRVRLPVNPAEQA